jgi:hypothetical protein
MIGNIVGRMAGLPLQQRPQKSSFFFLSKSKNIKFFNFNNQSINRTQSIINKSINNNHFLSMDSFDLRHLVHWRQLQRR